MTKTDIKHIEVTVDIYRTHIVDGQGFKIECLKCTDNLNPTNSWAIPSQVDSVAQLKSDVETYLIYVNEILEAMKEINGESS